MTSTNPNLPSIIYFRDVGKSINHIANRQFVKENVLFISATTKEATPEENTYLRDTLGIRTIIDTTWESGRVVAPPIANQPQAGGQDQTQSWLCINNTLGLRYCGIKLRRGPYMSKVFSEMSWWQKTKILAGAYEQNVSRVSEISTKTAFAKGATQESLRVLEESKVMIGELFDKIFGEEATYPVMMQSVRDSSILIMVLLLFLEVPIEILEMDIERSVIEAQAGRKDEPESEAASKFAEDYVLSAGTWARDVERWLKEKYGGAEGYLVAAGVTSKARDAVAGLLMVEDEEKLINV